MLFNCLSAHLIITKIHLGLLVTFNDTLSIIIEIILNFYMRILNHFHQAQIIRDVLRFHKIFIFQKMFNFL